MEMPLPTCCALPPPEAWLRVLHGFVGAGPVSEHLAGELMLSFSWLLSASCDAPGKSWGTGLRGLSRMTVPSRRKRDQESADDSGIRVLAEW